MTLKVYNKFTIAESLYFMVFNTGLWRGTTTCSM